jgi:hypothetical protein
MQSRRIVGMQVRGKVARFQPFRRRFIFVMRLFLIVTTLHHGGEANASPLEGHSV